MKVNPSCPKCKTNKRVIASHKRIYYKPGRLKRYLVATVAALSIPFAKVTQFFAWITQQFVTFITWLQSVKPLYKCNSCDKEFQGLQVQQRKKG